MTQTEATPVLGIDIGGSGIKAAPVDPSIGEKIVDRHRIATPRPATLESIESVVAEMVRYFDWSGPVGCAFPGVVSDGHTLTAANLDPSWIGEDTGARFSKATGLSVTMVNDADAAGVAEMAFGAGRGVPGVVMMVTLGTGIGTAMFVDGTLVPNTEFGHIEVDGVDAELSAAARVKDDKRQSWEVWGASVSRYLSVLENLVWPELIIIGGGVSKAFDSFAPLLEVRSPLVAAERRNDAGVIGAALVAANAACG